MTGLDSPFLDAIDVAAQQLQAPAAQPNLGFSPEFLDRIDTAQMMQDANARGQYQLAPGQMGIGPEPYGNWFTAGLQQGGYDVTGGGAAAPMLFTGHENAPGSEVAAGAANRSNEIEQARAQGGEGWLAKTGRGMVRSLTTMGLGQLAGAAARQPMAGGILAGSLSQANQSYNEARKKGLTHEHAMNHAWVQGVLEGGIETAFNLIGAGGAEKALANAFRKTVTTDLANSIKNATVGQAGKTLAKEFGKPALNEASGEALTTLFQNLDSYLEGVDPHAMDPEQLSQAILDSAVQALGQTGIAVTPTATMALIKRQQHQAKQRGGQAATQEQWNQIPEAQQPVQTPDWAQASNAQAPAPVPQEAPPAAATQAPVQQAPPVEQPTPLEVPAGPVHNPAPQVVEKGGEEGPLRTLAEKQPETLPAEHSSPVASEPPVKPGFERFYHGGAEYEGGSRWVSPDRAYAEGYAEKSGGILHYVDIPKDNPSLIKIFDDTGTGQKSPFSSFEATEELLKGKLHPVATEKASAKPSIPGGQTELFGGTEAQGKLFNAATAPKKSPPPAVPTKTESPADITISQPTIADQQELPIGQKSDKRAKAAQKAKATRQTKDEELTILRAATQHNVPVEHLNSYIDAEIQSDIDHWQNLKTAVDRVGQMTPTDRKKLAEGDQDSIPRKALDELQDSLENREGELLHSGIRMDEVLEALKNGMPPKPTAANPELVERAAVRLKEDLEKHATSFNPEEFGDVSFAKGEFPEIQTAGGKPPNQTVLEAMNRLEPGAMRGALVSAKELRKATGFPKEAFDKLLLKMSAGGQVSLHKHDYVAPLSPEEVSQLIHQPLQESGGAGSHPKGTYYTGVSIRQPERSAYKGTTRGVATNTQQGAAATRKSLGIEPSDVDGTPESVDAIRKTLEHDFDTALLRGRVNMPKAQGFYEWATEIGRLTSKAYQDLAVITHELTHHFDNKSEVQKQAPGDVVLEWGSLDYDPKRADPTEGFAEFGRYLLTTDEAPLVAPRAFQWFTQKYLPAHPEEQAKWAKARQLIDAYRTADPLDRAGTQMFAYGQRAAPLGLSKKQKFTEWLGRQITLQTRNWYDDAHLTKKLATAAEKKLGMTPGGFKNLAEAFSGADETQAQEALTEGVYTLGEERRKLYKSFKEVLAPLEADEFDLWKDYLGAVAAQEAREKVPGYNPGTLDADEKAIIDKVKQLGLADKFDKVNADFRGYHAALVVLSVDSGVISPESGKKIIESRDIFMPRRRIRESGLKHPVIQGFQDITRSMFGVKQPKRLKRGSGDPFLHPIDATILETLERYNSANHQEMEMAFMKRMLPSMGGAKGFGQWVVEAAPKTVMQPEKLESMLDSLTQEHEVNGVLRKPVLDPEDAKVIKNVSRLRRRQITKPLLKWFKTEYGTDDLATLDKLTENVPDIADKIAVWKQDFGEKPNEHIKRFYVNGEVHLAQYVNGDLYAEVQGLSSRFEASTLGKTLSGLLRWYDKLVTTPVKVGAVGVNAAFGPVNFFRDYVSSINQSKEQGAVERFYLPVVGLARYGADYVRSSLGGKRNPYAELFDSLGGKVATRFGSRKKAVKGLHAELTARSKKAALKARFLGNPINTLQDVLSIGEAGVRLPEFMAAIHNRGYHFDYQQDSWVKTSTGAAVKSLPRSVVTAAATAANEVTTNFRRKGTYARVADRAIPFFSANVAGTVRGLIGAKELLSGEGYQKRLLGMAMLMTFGLIANALAQKSDWYEGLDPDMKNRFWFFALPDGTPFLRLPKPYTYSAFINTMEGMIDWATTGSLNRFPEVARSEIKAALPPGLEGGIKDVAGLGTFWQLEMNEDKFGHKIEPLSMAESGIDKQYRTKPYTTGPAKFISKFLSSGRFGISPIQADFIADQWTGGSYSMYSNFAEGVATGTLRKEAVPIIKRFILRSDHQRSVSDFYEAYSDLSGAVATAKYLNPDTKRPDAIKQAQLQQWTRYKGVLGDIWKAGRDGTPEEKRGLERYAVGMADYALGRGQRSLYPNPLAKSKEKVPDAIAEAREEYIAKLADAMTNSPTRKPREPFEKFRERFMLASVETKWAGDELRKLGYEPQDVVNVMRARLRKQGRMISMESAAEIRRAMAKK